MIESYSTFKEFEEYCHRCNPEYSQGATIYIEDENKFYVYTDFAWVEQSQPKHSEGPSMTLYDFNKEIISNFNPYTEEQWEKEITATNNWLRTTEGEYFMLLCRDINYYTILHRVKDEKEDSAGTVIKDCIDSLGQLLTTDYDLPKVEYWVRIEDDAVICLNLFRYDMGVEKFNG